MEEVTKEQVKEITVTADEQELIFKGIRPEGMNFEVYKKVRKDLDKTVKLYLGGKVVFKSKRLYLKAEIDKTKKEGVNLHDIKGKTYRKETVKKTVDTETKALV